MTTSHENKHARRFVRFKLRWRRPRGGVALYIHSHRPPREPVKWGKNTNRIRRYLVMTCKKLEFFPSRGSESVNEKIPNVGFQWLFWLEFASLVSPSRFCALKKIWSYSCDVITWYPNLPWRYRQCAQRRSLNCAEQYQHRAFRTIRNARCCYCSAWFWPQRRAHPLDLYSKLGYHVVMSPKHEYNFLEHKNKREKVGKQIRRYHRHNNDEPKGVPKSPEPSEAAVGISKAKFKVRRLVQGAGQAEMPKWWVCGSAADTRVLLHKVHWNIALNFVKWLQHEVLSHSANGLPHRLGLNGRYILNHRNICRRRNNRQARKMPNPRYIPIPATLSVAETFSVAQIFPIAEVFTVA